MKIPRTERALCRHRLLKAAAGVLDVLAGAAAGWCCQAMAQRLLAANAPYLLRACIPLLKTPLTALYRHAARRLWKRAQARLPD